jgi:putative membrane protein
MIVWLLIAGILIASLIWHFQAKRRRRVRERVRVAMERSMGLEVLSNRYARGEIGRDEYLQKKTDILEFQALTQRVAASRAA